eukprot:s2777_g6.t1
MVKETLTLLVQSNGLMAILSGFLVALTSLALFAADVLPGFGRLPYAGSSWSCWGLLGGFVGCLGALLWRPCRQISQERAALEAVEAEAVEKGEPEASLVHPWLGLASVLSFLMIWAGMVPVTVAPVEGTLRLTISYMLLAGCIMSVFTAVALRRHFASGKEHFSHAWTVAVSSPVCWGFADVAVSLFRSGWNDTAWEYCIYGAAIWLLVAPGCFNYFLWLAKTLPAADPERICREVLITVVMVLLALPPVLAVCACFLWVRAAAWGPRPALMRAALFSGIMLLSCTVPRVIMACRRHCKRRAAETEANRN